jgi:nucleotide-binding universal stress UspA family protein
MLKRILFYGDFSESSDRAFRYVINLAKTYHAKLFILHVIRDLANREQLFAYLSPTQLKELEASQKEKINQKISIHYLQKMDEFLDYEILLRRGVDFREIILAAEKESVDIIVMGTRGRKSITDILLGNTSEIVAKSSLCPTLIVSLPEKRSLIF